MDYKLEKLKVKKKNIVVFLGIGTNKGNRKRNILLALELLNKHKEIKILKVSKMLKNPPQEGIKTGFFLNGAIKLLTSLTPKELLSYCKKIEKRLGRNIQSSYVKNKKKKSRTIDLDILFYGDKIINKEGLTIPHPMLHKRYFVLIPLLELEGDFIHPVYKKTIEELYLACFSSGIPKSVRAGLNVEAKAPPIPKPPSPRIEALSLSSFK